MERDDSFAETLNLALGWWGEPGLQLSESLCVFLHSDDIFEPLHQAIFTMKLRHVFILSAIALQTTFAAQAADFTVKSKSIAQGATVSAEQYWNNFGCTGGNVMPELQWSGAPEGTRSFAVTFYDQDAPTGSGFWHWVAYDIPATVTSLPGGKDGGTLPAGAIEGNTDLGKPGYFGPCPPVGRTHNLVFTVHALKVDKLPVDKGASPALVGFFLTQNRIGEAKLSIKAGPRK